MRPVVRAQVDRARAPPRSLRAARRPARRSLADEREDRAVVIGVGVDVEQPACAAERRADRLDRRRGRALRRSSEPTRAAARPYSRSGEGVLRPARAGVRRLVARRGLFADRDRPGWEDELDELDGRARRAPAGADARRRLRHRLPDPASAAARSSGSTRARDAGGCAAARRRARRSSRATHSRCRSPTAASTACSPSHFYGHLEEPSGALPRRGAARRAGARRRRRVAGRTRRSTRSGRSGCSRTAPAGRSTSAASSRQALADELGGGEVLTRAAGSSSVRSPQ